jgi:primosomal protein N' (replication factor Y)
MSVLPGPRYVEIAVNSGLPHRGPFSYAVPDGMDLAPGDAVLVPFGRRTVQGIVMKQVAVPAVAEPRSVEAKLYERPVVTEERLRLASWISEYYLSPLFPAVALMLPPGFERRPLTFYEPLLTAEEAGRVPLPPRQRAVLTALIETGVSEAADIEKRSAVAGVASALSQLVRRGLVRETYGLARPSVRAKHIPYVELSVSPEAALAEAARLEGQRRRRLAAVLRLLAADQAAPASHLRARARAGIPDLEPLVKAGLVRVSSRSVERDPLAGRDFARLDPPVLTAEQGAAFAPVEAALAARRHEAFLLHGVTGSGKTEIYLRSLQACLEQGRRGIVLVPEIALTPQTIRRFAERFSGQVAVLHSGLSPGEAFDQWHGIREGRYGVVIGSRSALFAPQPDLGLVIIDEEHEWTYKQQDQAPRYHAREAAERLCELTGAVLLLGSATPDVVSYQRSLWGRYRLLELRERVRPVLDAAGRVTGIRSSAAMPPVDVVDMRDELRSGNRSIFSRPLQLALYQTLARGEQAILFLNRRGSAGFVQCRDCGYVPQCPSCAIALSLHTGVAPTLRRRTRGAASQPPAPVEVMLCHQCNRSRRPFERCPTCGGGRLRPMGLGVERVEEEVARLFPQARALRWDRDVTRGRNAHEKILASFVDGKADILIGTQMVAKGLDLPAVTLVGVISADIGLHIPDFRSGERTFQLLTQVAGRAGRALSDAGGPPAGQVVVQTYTPDNYAIVAAAQHDYDLFFAAESAIRRESRYPPFTRLARLLYVDADEERGLRAAARLAQTLRDESARLGLPGLEVLGPTPPYVPKWHGRFRWQLIVRGPDPQELLAPLKLPPGWTLDIDPATLA